MEFLITLKTMFWWELPM